MDDCKTEKASLQRISALCGSLCKEIEKHENRKRSIWKRIKECLGPQYKTSSDPELQQIVQIQHSITTISAFLSKNRHLPEICNNEHFGEDLSSLIDQLDQHQGIYADFLKEQVTRLRDALDFSAPVPQGNTDSSWKKVCDATKQFFGEDGTLGKLTAFVAAFFLFFYNYLRYYYDLGFYSDYFGVPTQFIEKPDLQSVTVSIGPVVILLIIFFSIASILLWLEHCLEKRAKKGFTIFSVIIVTVISILVIFLPHSAFFNDFALDLASIFITLLSYIFICILLSFLLWDNRNNDDKLIRKLHIPWFILFISILLCLLYFPGGMQNNGKNSANREKSFSIITGNKNDESILLAEIPMESDNREEKTANLSSGVYRVVLYTTDDSFIIAQCKVTNEGDNKYSLDIYKDRIASVSKDGWELCVLEFDPVTPMFLGDQYPDPITETTSPSETEGPSDPDSSNDTISESESSGSIVHNMVVNVENPEECPDNCNCCTCIIECG